MLDYKLLDALCAVVEEGGFERAARRLNITQSAVSQRIRQLEENLGRAVLARTQPPAPTEAGKRLLRHARRVLLLEADLDRRMQPVAQGELAWQTLALAVNADTLATWFAGAVLPLLAAERLLLDLRVDDQELTHALLRSGEVAGCISTRPEPTQGCRAQYLGSMRYHCCAAPAFARRWFPAGLGLEAARLAPALVFNRQDVLHDRYLAQRLGESPAEAPRHHVPDSERFVDFVAGGAGFGMVPHLQCAARLERGELMDLAPDAPHRVPLYWHCWNIPSALLTRLGRHLRQAAREALVQEPHQDSHCHPHG